MKLENMILFNRPPSSRWNVEVQDHTVTSIETYKPNPGTGSAGQSSPPSLLLPALCHPHIHLDKAYLLTSESNVNNSAHAHSPPNPANSFPSYADLAPTSNTFTEALELTSKAKSRYTYPDLQLRGSQLLATATTQGVTAARCFVEVDHVTGRKCVDVGVELKREFEDRGMMRVQLVAFAQDPIFSSEHGEANRTLLEEVLAQHCSESTGSDPATVTTTQAAARRPVSSSCSPPQLKTSAIEVLGTTPYVETTPSASHSNIEWAIQTALKHNLHLDFHLDYNLDPSQPALVWDVISLLTKNDWLGTSHHPPQADRTQRATRNSKMVTLGHCTRLTRFSAAEWTRLSEHIHAAGLQDSVSFVGLPTSDLFMMGRPSDADAGGEQSQPYHRPRGTLPVPAMAKTYGLRACLGVNNVGNAFTPWGTGDPLALAGLGVGVYQDGTAAGAEVLFGGVSWAARACVGLGGEREGMIEEGMKLGLDFDGEEACGEKGEGDGMTGKGKETGCGGLLLIRNETYVGHPGQLGMKVPARHRLNIRDVVWDVPEVRLREVIR